MVGTRPWGDMDDRRTTTARPRLSRPDRHAQLLDVARDLIREEGTDRLTLARLATTAGVSKPVVYDHFGDRAGVLTELYREFATRQQDALTAALRTATPDLDAVIGVVAEAYIGCCLAEGRELADVVAALAASPALARLRRDAEDAYLDQCRRALEPYCRSLDAPGLRAVVGAGDALARDATTGRISAEEACSALARVIAAMATSEDPAETTRRTTP